MTGENSSLCALYGKYNARFASMLLDIRNLE